MELELLKKEKNIIQMKVKGADDTLLYPLIHQLLVDDNVTNTSYVVGHPELDLPVLTVEVKNGKPQAALKKAAKALISEFTDTIAKIEEKLG